MIKLLQLAGVCGLSLLLYLLCFGFVVDRPLVVDAAQDLLAAKLRYAANAHSPKVFILAGSNARFSHSCAILEQELGRPCVNLGVSADVGIDWVIQRAKPYMRLGDIVYIPLEYDLYFSPPAKLFTGSDAAYRFRYDKRSLMSRGPEGVLRAAFMFDLGTLVQSAGEMMLSARGIKRRTGLSTINVQGDEIDHGDREAKPYERLIRSEQFDLPSPNDFAVGRDGTQAALASFLDWCRANHVLTIGGLPTIFEDAYVPAQVIADIEKIYRDHGAPFIVLPDKSRFPRSQFFDTEYHLRDNAQIAHSRELAVALKPYLSQGVSH